VIERLSASVLSVRKSRSRLGGGAVFRTRFDADVLPMFLSAKEIDARGSGALAEESEWYVIRTKQHKEGFVKQQLVQLQLVKETYLPLLRTKVRYLGKLIEKIEPLFPCYLFAHFSLARAHYKIRHQPGVAHVVCAGGGPCAVDIATIQAIKSRETDGIVVLKEQASLRPQQRVNINVGPFSGMEVIFERYLSGAERVAVLLHSIGNGSVRAVLNVESVSP
jgi:transcriptional antiterminator RfaH